MIVFCRLAAAGEIERKNLFCFELFSLAQYLCSAISVALCICHCGFVIVHLPFGPVVKRVEAKSQWRILQNAY